MAENSIKQKIFEVFFPFFVVIAGIAIRLFVSSFGYNVDIVNFWNTTNFIIDGENVYSATDKYNYGPIWGYFIAFFTKIIGINDIIHFRFLITILLTLCDLVIAYIVMRKTNIYLAAFFFLNPISIFVTGYHGQFDTFAVMCGLIAICFVSSTASKLSFFAGLVFLGLSLAAKHILFLLPIWLFISEKNSFRKVSFLLIPYGLFFAAFLPFIPEGFSGILNNVFAYRSFNNAPFWSFVIPYSLYLFVPKIVLFIGSLLLCGILFKEKNPLELYIHYLATTFIFSSAIALQYLIIPLLFIILNYNRWFLLYLVLGSLTYLAHNDGLSLPFLRDYVGWNGRFGIHLSVLAFFVGFVATKFNLRNLYLDVRNYFLSRIGI